MLDELKLQIELAQNNVDEMHSYLDDAIENLSDAETELEKAQEALAEYLKEQ